MEITYSDLTSLRAYERLSMRSPVSLKDILTPTRVASCKIPIGGGLTYSYAAMPLDSDMMDILQALADEQELILKYRAVLHGEVMNPGEKRMVLHHLTRGQLGPAVVHEGDDLRAFYVEQHERIKAFCKKVHTKELVGSTGRPFDTVVQIGIGGSDLGPRALYLALKGYGQSKGQGRDLLRAEFISNVDPDDAAALLRTLDFETTLFILVSKSGTTQETLTNRDLALQKLADSGIPGMDPARHMVAVTSRTSPLASSSDFLDSFYIDDFIGGRYSSTSAVGDLVLSLAFGPEVMEELLEGAHEADAAALEPSLSHNAAMTDALIGVYLRNIRGMRATAVLPYSQALSRFPAHLQQMDMESNGKSVNRFGEPVEYETGPVIFGEPGTNGQHSFYQLLHQGTDIMPLQFIGFSDPQYGEDIVIEGSTSQKKLNANLVAQIVAFALGQDNANPNKRFAGERPSSLIFGKQLTPKALGALLAHFENKVMFQGFLWNLNSFDQEGVQLGKVLANKVLSGNSGNPLLEAYVDLLD